MQCCLIVKKIKKLISHYKLSREMDFQKKLDFLKSQTYDYYLQKIIKRRYTDGQIDFIEPMYTQRKIMCLEASTLANEAVEGMLFLFGRKHIEYCYAKRIKELKK